MKRLQVDFVVPSLWRLPVAARARLLLVALALLTFFAGMAITWQWLRLDRQVEAANAALALARQQVALQTPPARVSLVLSELEIIAINSAIGQLNTPWPALLDAFESVATPDTALLQIEPDHRRRLVKGLAEAKDHQHLLAYLAALGSTRPFAGAMVSKQEINEKDPTRPIRFLFEALLEGGADEVAGGQPRDEP
ncbi:hypothetical protein [Candidatus Accumulibacter phosphatis]|uniref:Putative secretion system X transmembrane protein 1 n=2 Tax=Candidatus Accumulibacter TaxID=327159 RepID=A0A5S4EL66_9PROT|nr:hypothetical protein [Candidatus Accumulibacter phosphatis]TMQ76111.1 putative secretion system X transmembrane protein 1 [Candidatus Accumulibacter phosphatis]